MVPGSSTSSSSSFPSSTSMTPSRQEIDHPTSSSSLSTSPTMTLSTVSSDNETGARRDLCGIDSFSVIVSRKHVERQERGNLLTKPTKYPKTKKISKKIWWMMVFLKTETHTVLFMYLQSPHPREVRVCKHSVCVYSFP